MEDLQTDTLSDYGKNQNAESTDPKSSKDHENVCAATLLNGIEEIDDPLDLMDHCDNETIGSNSDIWKGSDSDDENFENKDNSQENSELNKDMNGDTQPKPTETSNEIYQPQPDDGKVNEPVPGGDKIDEENIEKNSLTEIETDANKHISNSKQTVPNSVIESEEQIEQDKDKSNDKSELDRNLNSDDTEGKNSLITDNFKEKGPQSDNTGEQKLPENMDQEKDHSKVNGQKETAANMDAEKDSDVTDKNITEKDPSTENDPLRTDLTEKNLLNTNATEKSPLADDADKNHVVPKRPDRNNEGQDDNESQMDYNDDEDDDFNPLLFCPEVSMAVDENPVITNSGPVPNDGNSSPLPYEPVFSTYVDEVTGAEISFNLTAEEQELRKRLYGPTNPVQISKIHCTACNVHLGSALEGQSNRFVHPLLKVLICKECYHFYTSGEFEKDEDGSELYCRWCGQGGQVLCCSKCEFVFCKRCIRTNFGRKKMFEIRDSDSWDCFRCVPSQIITQRIACYEFFEYVRREMARASSVNNSEIWSKDHSRCCSSKRRAMENGEEVKRPKKKKGDVDPDYNPILEKPIVVPSPQPSLSSTMHTSTPIKAQFSTANKGIVPPKSVQILPRFNKPKDNDIEFVRHIPAPQVGINPVRPGGSVTGYRTMLPPHMRPILQSSTLVRINSQPLPPLLSTGARVLNNSSQARSISSSNMMKHEWFEKTVRAAARVNSHLSYTLTQLNKAQSQAASVEELAVVHNKLQEILSSSINSLIQIRKNLRTEFIAGIKTVRLPSKKVESFANDDDVIFVSAPSTMPAPSTSQVKSVQNVPDPIIIIDNSKKLTTAVNSSSTKPAESTIEKPKSYLKVKSVSELQNVPSECITIPDDTPAPPPPQVKQNEKENEKSREPTPLLVDVVCNGVSNSETPTLESRNKTPVTQTDTPEPEHKSVEIQHKTSNSERKTPVLESNTQKVEPATKKIKLESKVTPSEQIRERRTRRNKENRINRIIYNIKHEASPEIKRMMSVTVELARVDLKDLQKRLPNGCH